MDTSQTTGSRPNVDGQPPDAAEKLEEAFAAYHGELVGTLYYLTGNLEDARDALQETFVKCWRHRQQVPQVHNLKAWIFRIALNTGRDARQTAWRRRREPLAGGEPMIESTQPRPDEAVVHTEELSQLRAAIAQLRPEEQEVFLLRQNGEMTYEQIAVAIGIPTGTVKTRMRLALSRLREALAET